MLDQLKELDTQLFLYLNNLGVETYDQFWLAVSGVSIWFPFYGLLLIGMFYSYKPKSFAWGLLFLSLTVVATDQGSVQLFKEQFMRLRPCHVDAIFDQMRLVKGGCGGKYGFISSHASNTFGLALFMGLALRHKFRWALGFLLLWAAMVSYSRIYLGVHYPLDIICGALYGALCGFLLHLAFAKFVNPVKRPVP